MPSLDALPSELLGTVTSYLFYEEWLKLFLCGSRALSTKLSQGVESCSFVLNRGLWPSLVTELHNLSELRVTSKHLMMKLEGTCDLPASSKKLRTLHLEHEALVLSLDSLLSRQPMPFPDLEELSVRTNASLANVNFLVQGAYPSTLTTLKLFSVNSAFDLVLEQLPPNLTHLEGSFVKIKYPEDLSWRFPSGIATFKCAVTAGLVKKAVKDALIAALPHSLTDLEFTNIFYNASLCVANLPRALTSLVCSEVVPLEKNSPEEFFKALPPALTRLDWMFSWLNKTSGAKDCLHMMPPSLTQINVPIQVESFGQMAPLLGRPLITMPSASPRIYSSCVEQLPPTLTELCNVYLDRAWPNLTSHFSSRLLRLSLFNWDDAWHQELPSTLKYFRVTSIALLSESLAKALPSTLETLELVCGGYHQRVMHDHSVFQLLPRNLTSLSLSGGGGSCTKLPAESASFLPKTLTRLIFWRIQPDSSAWYQHLPPKLEFLDIDMLELRLSDFVALQASNAPLLSLRFDIGLSVPKEGFGPVFPLLPKHLVEFKVTLATFIYRFENYTEQEAQEMPRSLVSLQLPKYTS